MLGEQYVEECIEFAKNYRGPQSSGDQDPWFISSTYSLDDAFVTSFIPDDPHAVSKAESLSFYAGIASEPKLLYRTGDKWSPPKGPEAQRCFKELLTVFSHPIIDVWNQGLAWKVVGVLDHHKILFSTIDVVRFKNLDVIEDDDKKAISPVTIWIGVIPNLTSPTAAHDAAKDVLALLSNDFKIDDVDVHFRESIYMRFAGPQLLPPASVSNLNSLVDVVGPLTPVLGLPIATRSRPHIQGTMGLYLEEGGDSGRLLGLTCRHVVIGPAEGNINYDCHSSVPAKDVILLGDRAYTDLLDLIKSSIGGQSFTAEYWKDVIANLEEKEKSTNHGIAEKAKADRIKRQRLLETEETKMVELKALFNQINSKEWKKINNRVLGQVLHSPAIALGVGEHRFTEDWAIFQVDRTKLGAGFKGNMIDLGMKLSPVEFIIKYNPRGDANWEFKYPLLDRLLPLHGTISNALMQSPDMWDRDGEPYLLVVKNGGSTGTTIGRANGAFSIVREYFYLDMSIHHTSMEWCIINYDSSKSEVFSKAGDSGSVIADIRGRIGGILTGATGRSDSTYITYATPFWWVLERIKSNVFPNAHLNIVVPA